MTTAACWVCDVKDTPDVLYLKGSPHLDLRKRSFLCVVAARNDRRKAPLSLAHGLEPEREGERDTEAHGLNEEDGVCCPS